jgi:hypothetical protein
VIGGMVTCPLCKGAGELDEEIADEFLAEWEDEDEGSMRISMGSRP